MPCAPAAGDAGGSESAAEKSNRDHGRMVNGDGERVDDNVPVCLQVGPEFALPGVTLNAPACVCVCEACVS